MKILTKSDPAERNQDLLDSIQPPYRVRITLQVKDAEGNYRALAGSVLLDEFKQDVVLGLLERLGRFLDPDDPTVG